MEVYKFHVAIHKKQHWINFRIGKQLFKFLMKLYLMIVTTDHYKMMIIRELIGKCQVFKIIKCNWLQLLDYFIKTHFMIHCNIFLKIIQPSINTIQVEQMITAEKSILQNEFFLPKIGFSLNESNAFSLARLLSYPDKNCHLLLFVVVPTLSRFFIVVGESLT